MADRAALNFSTGGPASAPPRDPSKARQPGAPASGSGWLDETPLGPQPGINHVDRLCEAQDAKDRAELMAKSAPQQPVLERLLELQTQLLQRLAEENK